MRASAAEVSAGRSRTSRPARTTGLGGASDLVNVAIVATALRGGGVWSVWASATERSASRGVMGRARSSSVGARTGSNPDCRSHKRRRSGLSSRSRGGAPNALRFVTNRLAHVENPSMRKSVDISALKCNGERVTYKRNGYTVTDASDGVRLTLELRLCRWGDRRARGVTAGALEPSLRAGAGGCNPAFRAADRLAAGSHRSARGHRAAVPGRAVRRYLRRSGARCASAVVRADNAGAQSGRHDDPGSSQWDGTTITAHMDPARAR